MSELLQSGTCKDHLQVRDLLARAVDADFERVARRLKAIPKEKPTKREEGGK